MRKVFVKTTKTVSNKDEWKELKVCSQIMMGSLIVDKKSKDGLNP